MRPRRRWLGLCVVLVAQFMVVVDGTVVNIAFPAIQRELQLSGARLTWVASAYLVAFGGLLLLCGRLGDIIGRRRVLLLGLGVFTVASAACGLAETAAQLIAARFVQGIGAAGASSAVLAIIAIECPDTEARAKAMSGYVFVSVAGGSCGLVAGGLVTQLFDWHAIFLINVPIGLVAIVLGRAVLSEPPRVIAPGGIDVIGAVLLTSASGLAIYALVGAAHKPWYSAAVALPCGAALVLAAALVLVEARVAHPLLPRRVLGFRGLIASSAVRGCMVMGMVAVSLFGALDMAAAGFGPLRIGLGFLPQSISVAVMSLGITTRLIKRFGAHRVLYGGLLLLAIALGTLAWRDAGAPYWPGRFASYSLVGIGAGMAFLPLLTLAMANVPPRDAGLASAIVSFSVQLAMAIHLSILGAVAASRTDALLARHAAAHDALVAGHHAGYATAIAGVLIGLALAVALLRPRGAPC